MKILKSQTIPGFSADRPNKGRRSFMCKIGAAMTAVLATAVPGMAKSHADKGLNSSVDELSRKLGMLEDENAIRTLHQTYENHLNNGRYEEAISLFSEDGEVVFNGGIFSGRKTGISRLYSNHFRAGLTGKKMEAAPGFQPESGQQKETITVSADRTSAVAQFPFSIQAGAPIVSDSQLIQMARLQGQGIMKWWEGGIYKVSYVKDTRDGGWKIKRLEYRALSKADYRPGRSYARPISIPSFSVTYPNDPTGPDRLIKQA